MSSKSEPFELARAIQRARQTYAEITDAAAISGSERLYQLTREAWQVADEADSEKALVSATIAFVSNSLAKRFESGEPTPDEAAQLHNALDQSFKNAFAMLSGELPLTEAAQHLTKFAKEYRKVTRELFG